MQAMTIHEISVAFLPVNVEDQKIEEEERTQRQRAAEPDGEIDHAIPNVVVTHNNHQHATRQGLATLCVQMHQSKSSRDDAVNDDVPVLFWRQALKERGRVPARANAQRIGSSRHLTCVIYLTSEAATLRHWFL